MTTNSLIPSKSNGNGLNNSGVSITKFGPIGQVGNCQFGGFGKSLNSIKPSQSYLGGSGHLQNNTNLSSQFCLLSPKVVPIINKSSQEISPIVGISPDPASTPKPEDVPNSSIKETQAFEMHAIGAALC